MIYSLMHPGSGAGNQLHRFIAGKVLALDKGFEHSVIGSEYSKIKSFMNLDMGQHADIPFTIEYPAGKIITHSDIPLWEEKTNYFNPESQFIEDNTIIDGEFQSIQYFGHRLHSINLWLKVEPIDISDNVCIIGFRGGEFYVFPELGLPKEYFEKGISLMRERNPDMKFEVHTDDPILAQKFFPNYKVINDIGINWRSMRYAKHAIIANSSFYILPRLLSGEITVAPRGWARRNTGEWSRPDNFYRDFEYV